MPAIQRRTFQGYDFLNTDRSFRFDRVAFNRPRAWITALERESDFAATFLLLYLDILIWSSSRLSYGISLEKVDCSIGKVSDKVDSSGRVINTHIFSIQVFPLTRFTVPLNTPMKPANPSCHWNPPGYLA